MPFPTNLWPEKSLNPTKIFKECISADLLWKKEKINNLSSCDFHLRGRWFPTDLISSWCKNGAVLIFILLFIGGELKPRHTKEQLICPKLHCNCDKARFRLQDRAQILILGCFPKKLFFSPFPSRPQEKYSYM